MDKVSKYKELLLISKQNNKRASGNTTRLVDAAVQAIFNDGEVTLYENKSVINSIAELDETLSILRRRLMNEHRVSQDALDVSHTYDPHQQLYMKTIKLRTWKKPTTTTNSAQKG